MEKIMIIDIVKDLDSNFKIIFTQKTVVNSSSFKGLMIFSFKTSDSKLFYTFRDYGKWLKMKDKNAILLLRLFRQAKQNTTSYNIT